MLADIVTTTVTIEVPRHASRGVCLCNADRKVQPHPVWAVEAVVEPRSRRQGTGMRALVRHALLLGQRLTLRRKRRPHSWADRNARPCRSTAPSGRRLDTRQHQASSRRTTCRRHCMLMLLLVLLVLLLVLLVLVLLLVLLVLVVRRRVLRRVTNRTTWPAQ